MLQFIDTIRNLADNLSEGIHRIKYKLRLENNKKYETCNKKYETYGIKYQYGNCCLEYRNFNRIQMFVL